MNLVSNAPMMNLDMNDDLSDLVSHTAVPHDVRLEVPLPGSDIPAKVQMLLPPGLREHEEFTFPMLVHV